MTPAEQKRLAREIAEHPGEWVLVKGSRVMAANRDLRVALRSLPEEERTRVTAMFCPREDYVGTVYF